MFVSSKNLEMVRSLVRPLGKRVELTVGRLLCTIEYENDEEAEDYAAALILELTALFDAVTELKVGLLQAMADRLTPLVAIANAYDQNGLDDEARKFCGKELEHKNERKAEDIEMVRGRGGKRLLTIADCLAARDAVRLLDPSLSVVAVSSPVERAAAIAVAEATVAWANDTARCHFCSLDSDIGRGHADDCPTGLYELAKAQGGRREERVESREEQSSK